MDLSDMKAAVEVLSELPTLDMQDWGDEEDRQKPIQWQIELGEYEGDGIAFIYLPRHKEVQPFDTDAQRQKLIDAGWFLSEEFGYWCHR